MNSHGHEAEVERLLLALPKGNRLAVVGSTSFHGDDSRGLCHRIAAAIAAIPGLIAITGGMSGVGEAFGKAFAQERQWRGSPDDLFHVLPRGFGPCASGITLFAGIDYEERREVLARLGQVYLVIEGGPATAHEITVARQRGAVIVPVARTGGYAAEVFAADCPPAPVSAADWNLLADRTVTVDTLVSTVANIVQATSCSLATTF